MIALAITSILLYVHSRLSRGRWGAAPPAPFVPFPAHGEGVQGIGSPYNHFPSVIPASFKIVCSTDPLCVPTFLTAELPEATGVEL